MKNCKKVLVITGAGISKPSGIETFRDKDGLWESVKIEDVATRKAYLTNPDKVFYFYKERALQYNKAQPNQAHYAIGKLEEYCLKNNMLFLLVTQNVDSLHEKGGSKKPVHVHGTIKIKNLETGELTDYNEESKYKPNLRPDVVLFEEPVRLDLSYYSNWIHDADLFLSIGTSDLVQPICNTPLYLNKNCKKVQFNIKKTIMSRVYDEIVIGSVEETVPKFVDNLING